MPDDYGGNGGGLGSGPRPITREKIEHWDETVVALRDTLLLMVVAFLAVVLILPITIITGPWGLVAFIPAGLHAVYLWIYDDEAWTRETLVIIGFIVAMVLSFAPDAALFWWPWRAQATRAGWWGARWPARWPDAIPGFIFARVLMAVGGAKAWGRVWFFVQRLIQEIIVPRVETVAKPENLHIEEYVNPYRPPPEPPKPPRANPNRAIPVNGAKPESRLRAIITGSKDVERDAPAWAVGNGDGVEIHTMRQEDPPGYYVETHPEDVPLVDFPVGLFRGGGVQAEEWAGWVLSDEDERTSARAAYPVYVTDGSGRELFRWMEAHHLCRQLRGNRRELTRKGRWTLEEVAGGRWRACGSTGAALPHPQEAAGAAVD